MADPPTLKNPFVGLRAFEEHEDYLFFGRSVQINDLLKKFSGSRFLAVIGSSGSGKSSLVKSGLLPAIYSGFLSVGRNWRVALLRPGNDPIGNMAQELARDGVLHSNTSDPEIPYQTIIESTLRRSGGGLVQAYRQAHLAPTENLLIVIDQFEELFRFSKYEAEANEGKSDALSFINLLLTAAQQRDYPVYVLLTMRSDFIGDCAQFRGLPEAINEGQYLVPRMTRDEIREAITGPIAVGGAQIAPRLLTRVLNDVGNNLDQLPILQHAMMRTWDAWQKKNTPTVPIDIEDYEKTGGMSTALSQHAEEAFAELTTEKQRRICELMFKALTDKAADARGTRRPTSVADLSTLTSADAEEVIPIVEIFRKPGRTFLMPPPNVPLNKKSIIDISHESIMRIWERLIKWTDEEALSAEIYLRLSEAAQLNKEGKTDLWRDPELEIGLKWYRSENPNETWAKRYNQNFDQSIKFLLDSEKKAIQDKKEKERALRNRRRIAVGAIIVLSLFSIAATLLWGRAQREKERADALRIEADNKTREAELATKAAEASAKQEKFAKQAAFFSADQARRARDSAESNLTRAVKAEKDANRERDIARNAEKKAQDLLNKTLEQNREIAASEYQRRIREGPTEEDSITTANWYYKYYAYCYHLDALKKLGVRRAVIKNDELYDKLYYSLKFGKNKEDEKFVIAKSVNSNPTPGSIPEKISLGNNDSIVVSNDKLELHYGGKGNTVYPFNSRVSAVAKDDADKRILIATEDNVLTVYEYDKQYHPVSTNTIPMGGQVTALDYYSDSLIFFGLKTGEIGYINYKKDRKNQPVYWNELDSRITAVDFFVKENSACYLLATSSRGKAVVYELGSTANLKNFLNENKKLTGIELPENFGEIRSAKYLSKDTIELETFRSIYKWNPFTDKLLGKLKERLYETKPDSLELYSIINEPPKLYQDK